MTEYDKQIMIAALKEGYKDFWKDQIREMIDRKSEKLFDKQHNV